jgi:hypothetical protein
MAGVSGLLSETVMRIRTIKPEFWMHEGLCALPEFTRLLAIALLNWADDEGYFMANPALLRGSLFPFLDDSKKIPRSLQELSSVGWIDLGRDQQGRDVGRVCNFSKHQRVDKPKPSEIKASSAFQDASKNDLGGLLEDSKEEGKGKEGNGKEEVSLPLPFPSQAFADAWAKWVSHRKEIKKKLTPTMVAAQFENFTRMGETRSIDMILHTIAKGWQGLREDEDAQAHKPKHKLMFT